MIFKDRISLITGASQGIGEAIALDFAREGATIVLVDIQKDKLDEVAAPHRRRRRPGRRLHGRRLEARPGRRPSAEAVRPTFGKIDHLVNNAGITRDNLLMRMKEEEWDAVLAVNLKGAFNFSKAVIRSMIQARSGRIVNLASVVGVMGNAGQANYSASKAGLIGFSKSLAREVAGRNITVNCRRPGLHRHGHDRERCPRRSRRRSWRASRCSGSGTRTTSRRPCGSSARTTPPTSPARSSTSTAACIRRPNRIRVQQILWRLPWKETNC